MSGIDQEVLHGFVQEVTGYLPVIRAGVAALRAAPDAGAELEETHRCVHTIKGAAAMVGLPELSHIAFHLEEVVESLMKEPGGSSPELLDGIDASVTHIEEYLVGVAGGLMEQPALAAAATRHVRWFRGLPPDEAAIPIDGTSPTEQPEATETLSDSEISVPVPDLTLQPEPGAVAVEYPDEPPAALEPEPAPEGDTPPMEHSEATETLPDSEIPAPMPDLTQWPEFSDEAAARLDDPPAIFGSEPASELEELPEPEVAFEPEPLPELPPDEAAVPIDGTSPTEQPEVTETLSDSEIPVPMPDLTQWPEAGDVADVPPTTFGLEHTPEGDAPPVEHSETTETLPDIEIPNIPMPDLTRWPEFSDEAAAHLDDPPAALEPKLTSDDALLEQPEATGTLPDSEIPNIPMPDLTRWPEFGDEAAAHLDDPPAIFGSEPASELEELSEPEVAFEPEPLPELGAFESVMGGEVEAAFEPGAISEPVASPEPELAGELPSESSDGEIPAELLEVFRLEADDHIRVLTTLLPQVRTDPTDRNHWQLIRRAAHTLKGTAGLVGFDDVTHLSHRMEDLLDLYFEGTRTATDDEIDALLAAADVIAESVERRSNRAAFAAAHARLEAFLGSQTGLAEVAEVAEPVAAAPVAAANEAAPARETTEEFVRVPIQKLDEIAKLIGELAIARTALEQRVAGFARLLAEAHPAADRLDRVSGKLDKGYEASTLARSMVGAAHDGSGDGFDSLEFDRYTEIHLLSRELAETATDMRTVFAEFGHLHGELTGQLLRQVRLAGDVEDKLMQLRMMPLSTITAKLQRAARTAATTAGKKAELAIDGERTGLDKTMLDALADPLLHLVRNAVDHGLEPPEVRLALGKDAHGALTLRARHEGSHVVLTLADDGRGIDFEKVRATVVRRGLASPDHADAMSDGELADFLFRPGFSTREAVSELSGRGVGLDVVRSKVESIKGSVTVASRPGSGTTFTIRLPMTLAVVRALVVRAAGQTFAIPLEAVEQILRPGDVEVDHIGHDPVLRLAGSVCPLLPLAHVLHLPDQDEVDEARQSVVILGAGGRRVAIRVDQLIGGSEVVIKALGRHLRHMPAVAGATLLGDGSVVLILNPAELARLSIAPRTAPSRSATPRRRDRDGHSVLVVDDSPSIRRVLSLLLTGAGWRVTTAKDGLEALEFLQRGDAPDVVLTDVEMPRMDGYELLASVRSQASLAHLPVAVLTSRAADKHRRKALDLGASAYVVKPYQNENLLEILRHLVNPRDPRST